MQPAMSKSSLACLAGSLLFIAGCFPVELDVNSKGEILVPRQEGFFVYDPAMRKASLLLAARGDRPVFARFAPDGVHALLVCNTRTIDEYRFDRMPLSGGTPKTIYTGRKTALALFSPDAKTLAVSRVADTERKDALKAIEILLIDLVNDKTTTLSDETLISFRWFSNSKRLALFRTDDHQNGTFLGHLVEFDIATKKEKRLASAMTRQTMCIELRPDQQAVVFSAISAGKPGSKRELAEPSEAIGMSLWRWHAKDGSVTKIDDHAEYARFSPKGDKLLLARMDRTGQAELRVADADGGSARKLIDGVTMSINRDLLLPGWLDDETAYYFTTRHTYGVSEKSVTLMTIRTDGKKPQSIQPALDHAVNEIVKNLPEAEPPDEFAFLNEPVQVPRKKQADRAEGKREWTDMVFSADGMIVLAATVLIVAVLVVFVLRRRRRAARKPDAPS